MPTYSFFVLFFFLSLNNVFLIQSTFYRFIELLSRHTNSGGLCYELCVNLEGYEVTQWFWPVSSKDFLFTLTFSFISENKIDRIFTPGRSELWPMVLWMPAWKIPLFSSSMQRLSHHSVSPCLGRYLHRKLHRAVSNGSFFFSQYSRFSVLILWKISVLS